MKLRRTFKQWLRDIWRGYSDADMASALRKHRDRDIGRAYQLTRREFNAILAACICEEGLDPNCPIHPLHERRS